ncbi:MAG: hypothetical protein KAI55_01235 [Candidatus Aenigmarchaeota archaeon]|nr:hypothetical protein [Candidatus Aenigmarchaeota archaeon]
MKKYIAIIVSFIISICFLNTCFALCKLTTDDKNISIGGKYNISGIFVCEKIDLTDYASECTGETDVFWWNGTHWAIKAIKECTCSADTECSGYFCFNGMCKDFANNYYPSVSFKNKSITVPKDSLVKNIIEINNSFDRNDVFEVSITHNNTNDAMKILAFSYIEGKEWQENSTVAEYIVIANSSKKIMLLTRGFEEGICGGLVVKVTSKSTGYSATDTATYTTTSFEQKHFSNRSVPDISGFCFILIGFLVPMLFNNKNSFRSK